MSAFSRDKSANRTGRTCDTLHAQYHFKSCLSCALRWFPAGVAGSPPGEFIGLHTVSPQHLPALLFRLLTEVDLVRSSPCHPSPFAPRPSVPPLGRPFERPGRPFERPKTRPGPIPFAPSLRPHPPTCIPATRQINISGVLYVMSQFVMSLMVINCWSSDLGGPFIYFLKFVELTAVNLGAISSLAIAVLIASVVQVGAVGRRRRSLWLLASWQVGLC